MNQFAQRLDAAIEPFRNAEGTGVAYYREELCQAWFKCSRQDQQAATMNRVGATFASLTDLVDTLRSGVVLR